MITQDITFGDSILVALYDNQDIIFRECTTERKAWLLVVITRVYNDRRQWRWTDMILRSNYDSIRQSPEAMNKNGAYLFDRWGRARMKLRDYAGADTIFALSDSLYWLRAEQEGLQHAGITRDHAEMRINRAWSKHYMGLPQEARCLLESGVRPLQAACVAGCARLDSHFIWQADSLRALVARRSNPVRCEVAIPLYLQKNDDGFSFWESLLGFVLVVLLIGCMFAIRTHFKHTA